MPIMRPPVQGKGAEKRRSTTLTAVRRQNLARYCDDMFASLTRSDQRRTGEIYVSGLVHGSGKRSIRHLAAESEADCSDQSLQQFVNQSRWDPAPVRRRLANRLCERSAPTAWVVGEVAFDKHGSHSAGVERQYVRSYGRSSNCQIGLFVAIAGTDAAVPVTWRLAMPRSWDADDKRRRSARIPNEERHRPYWHHQIAALDDLAGDWGVPAAPVVLDARQSSSFVELVATLDGRGLDFLVQIDRTAPMRHHTTREARPNAGSNRRLPPAVDGRLSDLGAAFSGLPRTVVPWLEPATGQLVRAHFTRALVSSVLPGRPERDGTERPASAMPQVLLLEWGLGKTSPRAFWLTNMIDRHLEELVRLTRQPERVEVDITSMTDRFGLCDYEGRSFHGWHHHVTLASIAYAFHLENPGGEALDAHTTAIDLRRDAHA